MRDSFADDAGFPVPRCGSGGDGFRKKAKLAWPHAAADLADRLRG